MLNVMVKASMATMLLGIGLALHGCEEEHRADANAREWITSGEQAERQISMIERIGAENKREDVEGAGYITGMSGPEPSWETRPQTSNLRFVNDGGMHASIDLIDENSFEEVHIRVRRGEQTSLAVPAGRYGVVIAYGDRWRGGELATAVGTRQPKMVRTLEVRDKSIRNIELGRVPVRTNSPQRLRDA